MEYAILIIIIIGALLSIQVYIKRGVQGRLRAAADDIGDQFKPGDTYWNSVQYMNMTGNEVTTARIRNVYMDQYYNVVTNQVIGNQEQEYWGVDPTP